jgi:hypothetical protein
VISDQAILVLVMVGGFTLQIAGLVILGVFLSAQLRRTTDIARAVGALVVQETDKIRVLLGGR